MEAEVTEALVGATVDMGTETVGEVVGISTIAGLLGT